MFETRTLSGPSADLTSIGEGHRWLAGGEEPPAELPWWLRPLADWSWRRRLELAEAESDREA